MSNEPERSQEPIEETVRVAGRRPRPSETGAAHAYAQAHAAWQELVRDQARRRQRLTASALLAASLAAVIVAFGAWLTPQPSQEVARVELVRGDATVVTLGGTASGLHAHDPISAGTIIETTANARLALRLAIGHSLRLDHDTRVVMLGGDRLRLERGRLYADSGTAGAERPLRIITPRGAVEDIGTQFQVAWRERELRVQVREGSILLHGGHGNLKAQVGAGEILEVSRSGDVARTEGASFGAEWTWVAEAAPELDRSERRLEHVLAWICRELGYELRYADTPTQRAAAQVVLEGSLEGLTPAQTLEVLQTITTFRYRRNGGELMLEPGNAP